MPNKDEDQSVRRSGRHRKLLYDSLSEAVIVDGKNNIIIDANRPMQRGAYGAIESNSHSHYGIVRRSTRGSGGLIEAGSLTRNAQNNRAVAASPETESETFDIYSRIKRRRSRNEVYYGSPLNSASVPPPKSRRIVLSDEEEVVEEESNQSFPPLTAPKKSTRSKNDLGVSKGSNSVVVGEEESTCSEEDEVAPRQYYLREHRPVVKRYEVLPQPKYTQSKECLSYRSRPSRESHKTRVTYFSPVRRRHNRSTTPSRSSSTSSDQGDNNLIASPDKNFEKRSAKSLIRAKERFLPLNMKPGEARQAGVIRDRMRTAGAGGASCSDIDPMALDSKTTFESVGGLDHHLRSLKEMILFPFIYPQVFSKFNVTPPRGVLFYGPPGTGKTLVARALSNECSKGGRKVAFFMRKGADCLSKWVGESERQLRLLFDQAYTMRPSIIFFDEIDGLAPVRSSRQDQIHSSIVSTLLALMDGLDQRGEVIVIGATNRLDAIDPALRRPGRFDRELRFSLPDRQARRKILEIQTVAWEPRPSTETLDSLASDTVNLCGADLQGLCTETALVALRTTFPQIYESQKPLQLDMAKLNVTTWHFQKALSRITPASKRDLQLPSDQLKAPFSHLLGSVVQNIVDLHVQEYVAVTQTTVVDQLEMGTCPLPGRRLILTSVGAEYGVTTHVLPAVLHALDHHPIFSLPLSVVVGSTNRSAEETVVEIVSQAIRAAKTGAGASVLYLPVIEETVDVVNCGVWRTILSMVTNCGLLTPLLVIATSHIAFDQLPQSVQSLFPDHHFALQHNKHYHLRAFFTNILLHIACTPPPPITSLADLAELPVAETPPPRALSKEEKKALRKQEEVLLRELRIFLREMLTRLIRDRRFTPFLKAVDREDAPDYYDIIDNAMDLTTIGNKLDQHQYEAVVDFLGDVDLITANALEYNPQNSDYGCEIRRRACALRDCAYALIETEIDPEFESRIKEINESRKRRGDMQPAEPPPPFLFTAPKASVKKEVASGENAHHQYSTRSHKDVANDIRPRSVERCTKLMRRAKRGKVGHKRRRILAARSILNKYKSNRQLGATTCRASVPKSPVTCESEEAFSKASTPSLDLPFPSTQPKVLQVDRDALTKLVDILVSSHEQSSLHELQIIYSELMKPIHEHAAVWDRTPMVQCIINIVNKMHSS